MSLGIFRQTHLSEYRTWKMMRTRVNNPNFHKYPHYGGRGISIDPRWDDFETFLSDMGPKPTPSHSIERVDVDGNYEPANCRWGTPTEQARNQRLRKDSTSGVRGVSREPSGLWVAYIQDNHRMIWLGKYKNIEDAEIARLQGEVQFWGSAL